MRLGGLNEPNIILKSHLYLFLSFTAVILQIQARFVTSLSLKKWGSSANQT